MTQNYDIDIVLPWVDGADPQWRALFNQYAPKDMHITDTRAERYRDWGLLPYWFRGIEKFAPWVHTIHFVTNGQCPEWLNTDAPKLHIVNHSDYLPKDILPVFNVNPIELCMHHIPGLSEHFIYFNDDCFLLAPTPVTRFFQNGVPCDMAICNVLQPAYEGVMTHIMANDMACINRHFDKHTVIRNNWKKWFHPCYGLMSIRTLLTLPWPQFSNLYEHHLPNGFTKSLFEEVWEAEGKRIQATSLDRFRSISHCNQWLMRDWRLVKGDFIPYNVTKDSLSTILGVDDISFITNLIVHQRKRIISINDGTLSSADVTMIREELIRAFQTILPEKSSYEK